VGGKILLANGDLQEAGDIVWSDGRALGYGRGDNANRPQYNFRRPVDFCSGAFLLTPRALFSELGGFSLKYLPAYYEDTDYCMKVWAHGLRVIYEPRAVIRHYESASSGNNKNAHFLMENSRSKFVSAWTAELREHHLPMSPANIHRARFAAASSQLSLLYIDDAIPHRYLGAGYPRSNAILHEIVRLGYRVACLATSSALNGNEYTDIPRDVELLDFFADAERLDGFLATCDRVWISRPNNMKRFARQIITKRPFRKYKVIYDAEAIFAERDYLQCIVEGQRLSSDTLERWIAREVAPARAVDKVVCVSQHDAKHIAAAGVPTPVVVGHYVEPRPTPARFSERQDFLFVGRIHGGKDPNTDSMDYFCTTIWPALRDATGATLMIAGQGSDNFKQAGNLRGVRILGPVEDLARVYNAARVFVVPTRYAAGIPLKVYEAAGYGLPAVISTLVGIQTGWQHNQECLIGNTPAEFIECCSRLYRDESLWNRLRANSLRKVETELNWGTFASALRNVLEVPDGAPKS
jgi:glycosyltransferase involved in cell wall biosynthesis